MTTNPPENDAVTQHFDVSELQELQWSLQPFLSLGEPKDQRKRKLTLVDWGQDKAKVIQCVRDLFSMSLVKAKALVDSVPAEVPIKKTNDRSNDAIPRAIHETVMDLERVGAKVHADPQEEWQVKPYEKDLFSVCPRLSLNPEWELVEQVYSGPDEGYGRVWAMPLHAEPSWREQPDLWRGYRPVEAHSFAEALMGDGTLESYRQASLLMREIDNLNGCWVDIDWRSHRLISEPTDHNWLWIQEEVAASSHMQPSVTSAPDGTITIRFFTESRHVQIRLVRHQDHYSPGSYQPKSDILVCATGGQGYVH